VTESVHASTATLAIIHDDRMFVCIGQLTVVVE
jgi:hypothetical protein